MRLRHSVLPWALASSLLAAPFARPLAQTATCVPGALEVRQVSFSGNDSIPARELEAVIETAPSSTLRRVTRKFGARRCLPEGGLVRDVARLMLYYRRKGYPRVAVDTAVERSKSGAEVRFAIREGQPIVVDSIDVRGVPDSMLRKRVQPALTLRAGQPLDHFALDGSSAAVVAALRRAGYLTATARTGERVDSAAFRAVTWIDVTPGPRVRLGEVRVDTKGTDEAKPRIPATRVRRLTGLQPGAVLGSQELTNARRSLDGIGIFDDIRISLDTIRGPPGGDATANVEVSTIEGPPNQLRVRAGYATLDCFRIQAHGQRAGVRRRAGRLELTASMSKIGVGEPLDFAPGMCSSDVRADPYSSRLNYYVGGTFSVAAPARRPGTRSVSLYTERRSEYLAYLKTTYLGGSAALTRRFSRRWSTTVAYDLSYSRTEAEPAVLCATFSACLQSDRAQFTEALPFGVLSAVGSYDATDLITEPTRGYTMRAEFRIAPQWLGTAVRQQVIGGRLGGSAYFSKSARTVIATRLELAVVNTIGAADFIPQSERLFAGGASTIRGFVQNEVGSRVYIVDSVRVRVLRDTLLWAFPPDSNDWRTVPTGGTLSAVANVELRVRPPVLTSFLQFVGFVDAGTVWARGEGELKNTPVVVTPGVGMRISTPIGPIRFDVAYNGYAPPAGPAYRDVSLGYETAPLYCVSPGNRLPVTGAGQTDPEGQVIPPTQAEGPCPSTFEPPRPSGFLNRLTFHFSIGHAF